MTIKDDQFRKGMDQQALSDNIVIWERLDSIGFSHLRKKYPRRQHLPNYQGNASIALSSLDVALIAEETGKSVHWIITGERDPFEVKFIACDLSDTNY